MLLEQRREGMRHLVPAVLAGDDEETVVHCAPVLRSCGPSNDGERAACSCVARRSCERRAMVCDRAW
jgi:hypothetical protein